MEFSLDHLRPGRCAVITRMDVESTLNARLKSFGMVPNTIVCCQYCSPDGSVASLSCRGGVIAIRTKDLKRIWGRRE